MSKIKLFLKKSFESVGKYFLSKCLASLMIGIISFIVFQILDIAPSLLLASIAAITNMIPVLGGWIAIILCSLIVVFQDPIYILYVIATLLILQTIDQFLIIPLVVGKAVNLNPLIVFAVVFIGGAAFGFWGILLAVPVASIIKIAFTIFIFKQDNSTE